MLHHKIMSDSLHKKILHASRIQPWKDPDVPRASLSMLTSALLQLKFSLFPAFDYGTNVFGSCYVHGLCSNTALCCSWGSWWTLIYFTTCTLSFMLFVLLLTHTHWQQQQTYFNPEQSFLTQTQPITGLWSRTRISGTPVLLINKQFDASITHLTNCVGSWSQAASSVLWWNWRIWV